jgi:hypothetical protein
MSCTTFYLVRTLLSPHYNITHKYRGAAMKQFPVRLASQSEGKAMVLHIAIHGAVRKFRVRLYVGQK